MNYHPRITVITPSYNQGAFIEDTILSVLNQNYPNLQYIIIDGGSTDNSAEIIKKYGNKLDYWVSEKDNGQSSALNKGLQKANGEIVNWLNSDDQLAPNALFDIAALYLSNSHCNLFVGQTEFYSAETKYGKGGKVLFQTREITFAFGQVNQPAMFYKMAAVKKMGSLDESLDYCMDIDWWLKYLLHYGLETICETDSVWAMFRLHEGSKTVSSPLAFKNEKEKIYNRIFSFYGLVNEKSQSTSHENAYPKATTLALKKVLNYYRLWRSDELSLEKRKSEALRSWLKVNPFVLINSEKKRYFAVLKNILSK